MSGPHFRLVSGPGWNKKGLILHFFPII